MIRQGCLFRKVRICEPGLSPPTFVSGIGHQPSNIQPLYLVCFKIKEFTFHPKLTFMLSFHVFQIWFAVVVAFGFWNVKFLNFWCLHFNIFCKYHCLGKTPRFFFTHRILCVHCLPSGQQTQCGFLHPKQFPGASWGSLPYNPFQSWHHLLGLSIRNHRSRAQSHETLTAGANCPFRMPPDLLVTVNQHSIATSSGSMVCWDGSQNSGKHLNWFIRKDNRRHRWTARRRGGRGRSGRAPSTGASGRTHLPYSVIHMGAAWHRPRMDG